MKTVLSAAVLALTAASTASAQCTPTPNQFCVSFVGNYALNGISRPIITLTRGQTYTFQMVNIPSNHPFFITTNAAGGSGGAGRYLNGVAPSVSVFGNQAMTFNVPMDAPAVLFYQCSVHSNLGSRINIVDPPCAADFNMDGFLDFFDYDEYVTCFEDESMCHHGSADFNADGFVDFFDYDAFVIAFETGC